MAWTPSIESAYQSLRNGGLMIQKLVVVVMLMDSLSFLDVITKSTRSTENDS